MMDWPPPLVLYIKYFRIGGGAAPRGGNILNIFSPYTHLLVTRQIAQNIVKNRSKLAVDKTCIRMWGWAAPRGGNILQLFTDWL